MKLTDLFRYLKNVEEGLTLFDKENCFNIKIKCLYYQNGFLEDCKVDYLANYDLYDYISILYNFFKVNNLPLNYMDKIFTEDFEKCDYFFRLEMAYNPKIELVFDIKMEV